LISLFFSLLGVRMHAMSRSSNPVNIFSDSDPSHLDEVAEILATGFQRLLARQSSAQTADCGERSLDCAASQSGHAEALEGGGKA